MASILRLVKIGVEGEGPCTDVMEINRPDDLRGIADLGLTLAEAKQMFPVDAGKHHETLRRHTLKIGKALGACAAIRPDAEAPAVNKRPTGPPLKSGLRH